MAALRIADARAILGHALAVGRDAGYAPLTVAVVDASGELLALERSDGAVPLTARIAVGKARTALVTRMSSGDAAALPDEIIAAARVQLHGDFVTRAGGLPILDEEHGVVLGAIGASGAASEEDERAAEEGVRHWRSW